MPSPPRPPTSPPPTPETGSESSTVLILNWSRHDIENRVGLFRSGRYTSANKALGFVLAIALTSAFFALLAGIGSWSGSSLFSPSQLRNPSSFAERLKSPTNEVSAHLKTRLKDLTRSKLDAWQAPARLSDDLASDLIEDLNGVLKGPSFWNETRFQGVTLRSETQALLQSNPSTTPAPRLNRLLLDDAYPDEFSANPAIAFLRQFALVFMRPGNLFTTGPATFLFLWAISLLILKRLKLDYQERALALAAVPQNSDFILNESSARAVLERVHALVDHPRHFILLNRIDRALANLRNIGGLGDVSTILKSQAENDENQIASSYTLIGGMVWAIPVLGFIGTVQGLSTAIGNFTQTLARTNDINAMRTNLQSVTGGLSTAFETTLVALVMALFLQLYVSALQKRETDFLDECNDYCHQHVIAKLRLVAPAPEHLAPATQPEAPAS